MEYEARLQALLDHRVGLWDVIAKAQREGSLDSRIRDHATNDLAALVAALPNLAAVAFNGGTAEKTQFIGATEDEANAVLQDAAKQAADLAISALFATFERFVIEHLQTANRLVTF